MATMVKRLRDKRKESKKIGGYICGPTLNGLQHMGHLKTFVHSISQFESKKKTNQILTINLTDIGDSIYEQVSSRTSLLQIINYNARRFICNLKYLGLKPHRYNFQRASWNMKNIVKNIQKIVRSGEWQTSNIGGLRVINIKDKTEDFKWTAEKEDRFNKDASFKDFCLWRQHQKYNFFKLDLKSILGLKSAKISKGMPSWHMECASIIAKYNKPKSRLEKLEHYGCIDLKQIHHRNEGNLLKTLVPELKVKWNYIEPIIVSTTKGEQKLSKSVGNCDLISLKNYTQGKALIAFLKEMSPHKKTVIDKSKLQQHLTRFSLKIKRPAKIQNLLSKRESYKSKKNYKQADILRKKIEVLGYIIRDFQNKTEIYKKTTSIL